MWFVDFLFKNMFSGKLNKFTGTYILLSGSGSGPLLYIYTRLEKLWLPGIWVDDGLYCRDPGKKSMIPLPEPVRMDELEY